MLLWCVSICPLAAGGGCLFIKNVAKSSAVRVNKGGGGGEGIKKRVDGFEKCVRIRRIVSFVVVYIILAVETLAKKEERSN